MVFDIRLKSFLLLLLSVFFFFVLFIHSFIYLFIFFYGLSVAWVWLAVVASDRTVSLLELVASSSSLQYNNVTWPTSLESFLCFDFERENRSFAPLRTRKLFIIRTYARIMHQENKKRGDSQIPCN